MVPCHPDGRVNCGAACPIVAGGPVPASSSGVPGVVWVRAIGNRPILHVNPNGYSAVLGGDEHRKAGGDARRCDGWEPMVSWSGRRVCGSVDASKAGCGYEYFGESFFSKYARGSQPALRHS